eukprot:scaffold85249_cov27-Tisochrysis_lutea.AAC.1
MLTVAAAALLSSALAGPRAHPRVHARMSTDAAAASAWVGVPSALCERLCAAGFVRPMPIQQAAMALIAGGENAVLHAATGSGKTLAYLVPLLSRIEPGSSGLCGDGAGDGFRVVLAARADSYQLYARAHRTHGEQEVLLALSNGQDDISAQQICSSSLVVGTPQRLLEVLEKVGSGEAFRSCA